MVDGNEMGIWAQSSGERSIWLIEILFSFSVFNISKYVLYFVVLLSCSIAYLESFYY